MSPKEKSSGTGSRAGNKKNDANNKNGNSNSKDFCKTLLALARQDRHMAYRQRLLQTFLQVGASLSDIKEVFEMNRRALDRELLFEAGKLGVPPKILKFLLEKLNADLATYDRPYIIYRPTYARTDFQLKKDPHLLTSGNVCLGLQQLLLSNIVTLKVCSPEIGKPFWNLDEFIEFLVEATKSSRLKTLHLTFPKDYTPPKKAPTAATSKTPAPAAAKPSGNSLTTAITVEDDYSDVKTQSTSQPTKETTTKSTVMPDKIKTKLMRKKLEGCVLEDFRVKFDYSHKTCDSLLQLVKSISNLPNLKTFAIQVQKEAAKPKEFNQFKAELPEALGKLISSSKTLESLVADAKDWKKEADWEPLLKPLEKNPSLKRLLIHGFSPPTEAAIKALPRRYSQNEALHISLESVKRKLLAIVQKQNFTLSHVRFIIPGCQCQKKLNFDTDDCFKELDETFIPCSPQLITSTVPGCQNIPPPKHVPELFHLLALNANGRAKLGVKNLTHKQFLEGLTKYNTVIPDVPVLYALLRERTEYIPMLYAQIRQSKTLISSEIDELYLAAAGKMALPLERFATLCIRRSDDFSELYKLMRLFPTIWLDHLRTAKQIVQEQTRRTKRDYVSIEELPTRTQIVKTGEKTVTTGNTTSRVAVYGTRVVQTVNSKASKKDAKLPLKVIRLNVAASVGGATLTKFPKLTIGNKGNLMVQRKKKTNEATTNTLPGASIVKEGMKSKTAEPKRKKTKDILKDTSNQPTVTVSTTVKSTWKTSEKGKGKIDGKAKPGNATKPAKRKGAAATAKTKFAKTPSFLKIEGLDGIDFDDDDSSVELLEAKKPAVRGRSSVERRKIRAKKPSTKAPSVDLIDVTSDEDEPYEKGNDSDWDDGGLNDDDDGDESEWDE